MSTSPKHLGLRINLGDQKFFKLNLIFNRQHNIDPTTKVKVACPFLKEVFLKLFFSYILLYVNDKEKLKDKGKALKLNFTAHGDEYLNWGN